MAGLAAAHELASVNGDGPVRFDVTVYERNAIFGGKARSFPKVGSGTATATTCPASTASASSPATTATSRTP